MASLATFATGAWPAQHGIVAERWYDPDSRSLVSASEELLSAETLAAGVAADSRSRVTVIGHERAHAALFAGTPDARLYWLDELGRFASNGETQDWLAAFNAQKTSESARNARWMALGAKPDAAPLRTLTYTAERANDYLLLWRSSPFSMAAQFDLLNELLARENPGKGPGLDVYCLLAGSMEQLGYETGGRSPLMEQMALHADRRIEGLLAQLARTAGENGFTLAVAGAHGAPAEPRSEARERMTVHGEQVAQAAGRGLPEGASIEKYVYPFLYLKTGSRDAEAVRVAAARAAMRHPAVGGYYTAGGSCPAPAEWAQRFRNSFHATRSGDVMLSYRPGYIESFGEDRGVSYGSLYNYDAVVPVCFYGPQFRAAQHEEEIDAVDFAPTLARAAGVALPSSATGRVRAEAFAE